MYVTTAPIREDTEFNAVPYKNGQFDISTAPEADQHSVIHQGVRKGDAEARKQMPGRYYRVGTAPMVGPLKSVTVAGGNFLILRADVAEIVRQHDIGEADLMPIELIDFDNETSIDTEAFLLLPGTFHRTIDHASPHLIKNRYSRLPRFRLPHEEKKKAELKCLGHPPTGLALWWDETIDFAAFLNAALIEALKSAGLNDRLKASRIG